MDSTRNPAAAPAAVPALPAAGDVAAAGAPDPGGAAAVAGCEPGEEPGGGGPELAGLHAASVTAAAIAATAAAARAFRRPAVRAESFVMAASWPGQREAGRPAPLETVPGASSLRLVSRSPEGEINATEIGGGNAITMEGGTTSWAGRLLAVPAYLNACGGDLQKLTEVVGADACLGCGIRGLTQRSRAPQH